MKKQQIWPSLLTVMALTLFCLHDSRAFQSGAVSKEGAQIKSARDELSNTVESLNIGAALSLSDQPSAGYYRVSTAKSSGWIKADFVALKRKPYQLGSISEKGANVKSMPSASSQTLEYPRVGERVSLSLKTTNDYYHVSTHKTSGWIHKKYIYLLASDEDPTEIAQTETLGKGLRRFYLTSILLLDSAGVSPGGALQWAPRFRFGGSKFSLSPQLGVLFLFADTSVMVSEEVLLLAGFQLKERTCLEIGGGLEFGVFPTLPVLPVVHLQATTKLKRPALGFMDGFTAGFGVMFTDTYLVEGRIGFQFYI